MESFQRTRSVGSKPQNHINRPIKCDDWLIDAWISSASSTQLRRPLHCAIRIDCKTDRRYRSADRRSAHGWCPLCQRCTPKFPCPRAVRPSLVRQAGSSVELGPIEQAMRSAVRPADCAMYSKPTARLRPEQKPNANASPSDSKVRGGIFHASGLISSRCGRFTNSASALISFPRCNSAS